MSVINFMNYFLSTAAEGFVPSHAPLKNNSSVQSLSRVQFCATPWIAACQASLSITNSWSSLRLTSIESVMPSSHLILCRPLFLLPPIPPSIRVFSNESALRMRWPKSWSFSFSIIPSKEIPFQETQPRRGKNKSELQGLTLSSLVRACGMRRGVWGRASILSVMPNVAPDTHHVLVKL